MNLSKSLIEQILTNGGNFFFFIVTANLVGPMEFGQFGIMWACIQMIHGIAIQWILLPITSVPIRFETSHLINISRARLIRGTPAIILGIIVYGFIFSIEKGVLTILLLYLITISYIAVELARYVLIRENKIDRAIILQTAKWVGAFCVFFLITEVSLSAFSVLISIGSSVMMVCVWILLSNRGLIFSSPLSIESSHLDNYSAPLLRYGYVTTFHSIITTFVLTNINIALFGAIQVFRSLSNFFPVALQYIESHVSARLVGAGKSTLIGSGYTLCGIVFFALCVEMTVMHYDEVIVNAIFSDEYDKFSYLLPFVLGIAIFQALGRLLSVEVRLKEKTHVMDYSSILLIISAFLVLVAWQFNCDVEIILFIMVFTPLCQFLYLVLWKSRKI
ncbi:hypothetical protein [Nitrosomonas oligotropha]|uniref:O-antigen/teichoic acid export membrane protein n=1 Tax=Nitrosomonas oligotropha TaxID=42354 RepID=A0A1H8PJZ9_9PROT|nr:hypothetical protein [Nitrosomonas oligotropha]SDX40386.1 hypothetical protein SAMN05216300_1345 [Nitrosomonas oligotropha]SEO42270.1 hypothetical protein SAMN05216333_109117 [Nitrosomonas oligotropha]